MTLSRPFAAALLALAPVTAVAVAVGPVPAAVAHSVLESSTPADGSSVAKAPEKVALTFNEGLVPVGAQIEVEGPGGRVEEGVPTIDGPTITQSLAPERPAGDYTVKWRVTSADGHPIAGTVTFTALEAEGAQAAKPSTGRTTQPGPSAPASGDAAATTPAGSATASDSAPTGSSAPAATSTPSAGAEASDGTSTAWLWAAVPVALAVLGGLWALTRRGRRS